MINVFIGYDNKEKIPQIPQLGPQNEKSYTKIKNNNTLQKCVPNRGIWGIFGVFLGDWEMVKYFIISVV